MFIILYMYVVLKRGICMIIKCIQHLIIRNSSYADIVVLKFLEFPLTTVIQRVLKG